VDGLRALGCPDHDTGARTLDPAGRPYDETDDGGTIARDSLGTILAVDQWTPFEAVYCTDGSWGRISSLQSLDVATDLGQAIYDVDIWTGDLDSHVGNDTIVFFNGWGDGCFPSSRGLDASGNTVSFVVGTRTIRGG